MSKISTVCLEEAGFLTPTPTATPTRPQFLDSLNRSVPKLTLLSDEEEKEMEGGEIEVFANQEADDHLDKLLMEEEMSDAHITELALSVETKATKEDEIQTNGKEKEISEKQTEG